MRCRARPLWFPAWAEGRTDRLAHRTVLIIIGFIYYFDSILVVYCVLFYLCISMDSFIFSFLSFSPYILLFIITICILTRTQDGYLYYWVYLVF